VKERAARSTLSGYSHRIHRIDRDRTEGLLSALQRLVPRFRRSAEAAMTQAERSWYETARVSVLQWIRELQA
jgi:hypothetical protein